MIQLINTAPKFRKEDSKDFLLAGGYKLGAQYCESCLKKLNDIHSAVYENDTFFCSSQCSKDYRMEKVMSKKGGIRANV